MSNVTKITWKDEYDVRRQRSGKKLADDISWWKENIGGPETHGRTYQRFLRKQCLNCGPDCVGDYDEGRCGCTREEATRIMGICGKRHEETDYDALLKIGFDRGEARDLIREN